MPTDELTCTCFLRYAVGFGHYDVVKLLLDRRAKVTGRPILYACYRGYHKIMDLLLARKANPGECDDVSKCTPIITALAAKKFQVAEKLIKYARKKEHVTSVLLDCLRYPPSI